MKRGQSGFIKGPSEPDPIDQRTRIIPVALSTVKTFKCFATNNVILCTLVRNCFGKFFDFKARSSLGIVINFLLLSNAVKQVCKSLREDNALRKT